MNKYRQSSQKDASIKVTETLWKKAFCRDYRQELYTKMVWNDGVSNNVSEKHKLWMEWKQGNTSNEKYLEAKKKACRAVY